MFSARKVFITILALAIVSEEVCGHKLLLGAVHIAKKVALAKLHLMRPIARHLAAKKLIAVKLIGAKALIGAKVGLGAMAIRQLVAGGKKQVVAARPAPAPVMPLFAAAPVPVLPTFASFRSAISLPEINVPVRFSVGAPQPAIRSPVAQVASKTREATKV